MKNYYCKRFDRLKEEYWNCQVCLYNHNSSCLTYMALGCRSCSGFMSCTDCLSMQTMVKDYLREEKLKRICK